MTRYRYVICIQVYNDCKSRMQYRYILYASGNDLQQKIIVQSDYIIVYYTICLVCACQLKYIRQKTHIAEFVYQLSQKFLLYLYQAQSCKEFIMEIHFTELFISYLQKRNVYSYIRIIRYSAFSVSLVSHLRGLYFQSVFQFIGLFWFVFFNFQFFGVLARCVVVLYGFLASFPQFLFGAFSGVFIFIFKKQKFLDFWLNQDRVNYYLVDYTYIQIQIKYYVTTCIYICTNMQEVVLA
eukprot:TRINITY_DN2374_c0_g1_i11.p3 TRINITY_DN2374_c0_g1~~TRINITY_DN2374_c0_g1_i11.p3  ORF type:complete len:238 (+),score=-15.41 TRINITY_DN2374_c0_g1_i11:562-1275(+)